MNALTAFAEFIEAHRQGRAPAPDVLEYIVVHLRDYMGHTGTKSLDEVFGLKSAGPGRRDPWLAYVKELHALFYAHQMAAHIAIGFTIEEAAEAVAAQYASLGDFMGRKHKPPSAATARKVFFQHGGLWWAKSQEMYFEALSWDKHTRDRWIQLIPVEACPKRFRGCGK